MERHKCDLCGFPYEFIVILQGSKGCRTLCVSCCRIIGFPKGACPISDAFGKIDKRRKAEMDISIGQSCTKCGKSIKTSELWSHRVARRGVPGETARVADRSLYTHEPKCPESNT